MSWLTLGYLAAVAQLLMFWAVASTEEKRFVAEAKRTSVSHAFTLMVSRLKREVRLGGWILPKALAVGLAAWVVTTAIHAWLGSVGPHVVEPTTALAVVYTILISPAVEELMRAVGIHFLRPRVGGIAVALLITAILSTISHPIGACLPDSRLGYAAYMFILAAAWGAIYAWTKSWLASFTVHALWNLAWVVSVWASV